MGRVTTNFQDLSKNQYCAENEENKIMNNDDTGKFFSEALILASTNPQYDKRLFIELQVQNMKIASSEHVVYINCSECQNKKQFLYTTCSQHVLNMFSTCSELAIFMY